MHLGPRRDHTSYSVAHVEHASAPQVTLACVRDVRRCGTHRPGGKVLPAPLAIAQDAVAKLRQLRIYYSRPASDNLLHFRASYV